MIMHVAPRRVTLVSKDGPRSGVSIDLSTVLGVDLVTDTVRRVNVVVRLTNGARVIACTYHCLGSFAESSWKIMHLPMRNVTM